MNPCLIIRFASALLLGMTLLPACGDDGESNAREAAEWLRAYTEEHPPNWEWKTTSITVSEKNNVVMDVLVTTASHLEVLKLLPKLEQARIVQLACPPGDAEVWSILDDSHSLWVNLNDETGTITGATCRH